MSTEAARTWSQHVEHQMDYKTLEEIVQLELEVEGVEIVTKSVAQNVTAVDVASVGGEPSPKSRGSKRRVQTS